MTWVVTQTYELGWLGWKHNVTRLACVIPGRHPCELLGCWRLCVCMCACVCVVWVCVAGPQTQVSAQLFAFLNVRVCRARRYGFTSLELQLVVCGEQHIDIADLRASCKWVLVQL